MRRGSYRGRGYGSRYSGGGRGKAGVILGVVFVLALLGAAVWLIRSMFCTPAPAPTAVVLTSGPSPAATPTPTPEPPAPEFPEQPESLRGDRKGRIRELQCMVPEFVERTGGSKWLSALPTGSNRPSALPTTRGSSLRRRNRPCGRLRG